MDIKMTKEQFAPLAKVKLSETDKADILINLRREMAAEQSGVKPAATRRGPKRVLNPMLIGAVAAASIIVVATAISTGQMNLPWGPADTHVPRNFARAYAYTAVAPPKFNELQMINARSGWGWGYDNKGEFKLIRTADGGYLWSPIVLPVLPPRYDIARNQIGMSGYVQANFLDGANGWLAWIKDNQLSVLHTADGGQTWSVSHARMPLYAQSVANVVFISPTRGWIVAVSQAGMGGEHKILFETSDGGKVWRKLADDSTGLPHAGTVTGLMFTEQQRTGWFVSGSPLASGTVLYRTNDDGHTWNPVPIPVPSGLEGFFPERSTAPVFDGNRGVLTVTYTADNENVTVAYTTSDGGRSWTPTVVPGTSLAEPVFLDSQHGYAIRRSTGGVGVVATSDGGKTWRRLSTLKPADLAQYPNITKITFVNGSTGWILMESSDFARSKLLKTTDAGRTWSPQ